MRSMTGYGSGTVAFPGGQVNAEVRAVNHRFLEIKLFVPRGFSPWEEEFRTLIAAQVKRGRLELTLTFSGRAPRAYRVSVNHELAHAYYEAVMRLQRELHLSGNLDVTFLAARSDLFQVAEKPQPTKVELQAAKRALTQALTTLDRQRSREGRFLARDLRARALTLDRLRRTIERQRRKSQAVLHQNLLERVTSLLGRVESNHSRVYQEVAMLVQKNDITEELVRLHSHLEVMRELLRLHEPVGKRIDFLLQELQREINTIGAKADDALIRHLVVSAKEEVEKLREQVQNIE